MLRTIWTYGITFTLLSAIMLSSITSPYKIVHILHDSIHALDSLFSDSYHHHHHHPHSHELLDLLKQQQEESHDDHSFLNKNVDKMVSEIYELDILYQEFNFHTIIPKIEMLLNAYHPMELVDPPIV